MVSEEGVLCGRLPYHSEPVKACLRSDWADCLGVVDATFTLAPPQSCQRIVDITTRSYDLGQMMARYDPCAAVKVAACR